MLVCKLCNGMMVSNPKGKGWVCATEQCSNHEKVIKVVCENCGERDAVSEWIGEGGTLAWSHGWSAHWCELCCVRAQLEYAIKQAERIPELEQELEKLEKEE